jgi:uncharacterized membrane protein (UPF0127 family)
LAAGLAACQPSASSAVELGRSAAGLEQAPLTISSHAKKHRFVVEVARTADEQATGLMNRASLDPDRGMIFPFDPPREASFWMKNTLIPLDMIFVRADGSIANIASNTVPLSLEPVYSDGEVAAVLELAGGRSAELGVQAGDKVEWKQ